MKYIKFTAGMLEIPSSNSDIVQLNRDGFLPVIETDKPTCGDHETLSDTYEEFTDENGWKFYKHAYKVVVDTQLYEQEITQAKQLLDQTDYKIIKAIEQQLDISKLDDETRTAIEKRIAARAAINDKEVFTIKTI